MRRILICILMLGSLGCQRRENKTYSPPTVDRSMHPPTDEDFVCVQTQSLTPKERRMIYPFNQAQRIEVVSYTPQPILIFEVPPMPGEKHKVDTIPKPPMGLLTEDHKLNTASMKERITLTAAQIDQLADILYNYESAGETFGACFEPRHAVLFFAEGDQPFAYVEICFACDNFEASPEAFQVEIACPEKYVMLKTFFQKAGMQYGLDEE